MISKENIAATWAYIVRDHESWPMRFWLEVLAWAMSIGAAVLFAFTVPNVPFILYLTITVSGCAIYAWAAWTRGSVGMLANYVLLTIIDSVGLARIIAS